MIYLWMFLEFFKIGLFSLGGGLATIPFLVELAQSKKWFSVGQLLDMIAISEATPGPIGINMATFVGLQTAGVGGMIFSLFGLVLPAFLIILWAGHFLKKHYHSVHFQYIFYLLKPVVCSLIFFFILKTILTVFEQPYTNKLLAGALFVFYLLFQLGFKLHPTMLILIGALMGICLGL